MINWFYILREITNGFFLLTYLYSLCTYRYILCINYDFLTPRHFQDTFVILLIYYTVRQFNRISNKNNSCIIIIKPRIVLNMFTHTTTTHIFQPTTTRRHRGKLFILFIHSVRITVRYNFVHGDISK